MTRGGWAAAGLGLTLAALAAAVHAQPDPAVKAASDVVLLQLEAFRRDDFPAAYAYASASIKSQFDLPAFERMVRGGYPEIARSTSAVISHGEESEGRILLVVRVSGANGRRIEALYELIDEDGHWRINGVLARPDSTPRAGIS